MSAAGSRPRRTSRTGKPVIALFAVIGVWTTMRVVMIDGADPQTPRSQPTVASAPSDGEMSSTNVELARLSAPVRLPQDSAAPATLSSDDVRLVEQGTEPSSPVPASSPRIAMQPVMTAGPMAAQSAQREPNVGESAEPVVTTVTPAYPVRVALGSSKSDAPMRELDTKRANADVASAYPVRVALDEPDMRSDEAPEDSGAPASARRVIRLAGVDTDRSGSTPTPARYAAGHQVLFLAALSRAPLPPQVAASMGAAAQPQPAPKLLEREKLRRWSLDAWLFGRENGSLASPGPAPGTLGADQVGFVARYNLMPESPLAPSLYARASKALIEGGELESAFGAQLRPFGPFPLTLHGEVRSTRVGGRSFNRPAGFATTGFYDTRLPFGLLGRGYAQAGYVGGDFATAFADGQLIAERRIADWRGFDIRVGGGSWASAQRDVSRIDVGPLLSYSFSIDETPFRIQADYRQRVSGEATPDSGVALTVSTSF